MQRSIQRLTQTKYDVLVIGGGISGATIVWDAALRGLSAALIEKEDFGQATSANSLKTVHGGLRYLQNADFKRMRQSIRERRTLLRIAPHLVHPLACIMPTYGHLFKGREMMAAALIANDAISYDRNQLADPQKHLPRGRMATPDECLALVPGIEKEGLSGGTVWYDAQMYNSERLTLAFISSAAEQGAEIANYVAATGFLQEDGRIVGVTAHDSLGDADIEIAAHMVINAAGPWTDKVLGTLGDSRSDKSPHLGVQLAMAINVATRPIFGEYAVGISGKKARQNKDGAIGEDGRLEDGRLFFVSPWRGQSLIGTTYTAYQGDPNDFQVEWADVQALLDAVNAVYPPAQLTREDVLYVYAGMVPMTGINPRTGAVKRAKHYEIRDHAQDGLPGLITALGVKYTTARDVAEKVVNLAIKIRGERPFLSTSSHAPLVGGDIERFEAFLQEALDARPFDLDAGLLRPLLYNYGSVYADVLRFFRREEGLSDAKALLKAQIQYGIQYEMAQKLSDIIFRRTEIGVDGYPGQETLAFCAQVMGEQLAWTTARIQQEIAETTQFFAPALIVDKKGIEEH